MASSNKQHPIHQEKKPMAEGDEEMISGDERYKNLDPRMVELIEGEILERSPTVTWADIAGL